MDNAPNYYAIIPATVRYDKSLSFLERFLYCEITALSNINGYCFATNEYFANLYDKDEKTISRALSKLQAEKHIFMIYEQIGTKKTNRKIYLAVNKSAGDVIVTGETNTGDIFVTGEEQKILNAVRKNVTHNNITYKEIFNIITNIKKITKKDEHHDPRFEQFYTAYPKKANKGAAEKAFSKINPNEDLFKRIMQALNAQKKTEQWKKENIQFIPYASSWLNGKRWEDEVVNYSQPKKSNHTADLMKALDDF